MDMIFFGLLVNTVENGIADAPPSIRRNSDWPLDVVLKCEGSDEKLRKYRPRSDTLLSNSALPRLLVEVNSSASTYGSPPERIRMLITGAFIVRFANKFVRAYKEHKDFVLCCLCLGRWPCRSLYHTLFQLKQENSQRVYYHMRNLSLSLNTADGRIEFARILYNLLCVDVDQEQNNEMKHAIRLLNDKVEVRGLKMHTKDATKNTSRKRTRTHTGDDDSAGGGGRWRRR
ncbi:hypothetical protein BC826DRAFT_466259 [Russula brevipes]|nr:hypothetical protein BC826DRAFT_466259 [Russula brevipes]